MATDIGSGENTGSIRSKSCSSSIRCMSTEPTIPRQPIRPTRFIATTPIQKWATV
ncbi:hypothetical protein C4K18_2024 [Pseudomonas chlororaphis subsp. aurantiaca]|nr:hypothetical protein C4K18_2024 [Pseudomonas chlororaphis subsp. aurantiaca]